MHNQHDPLSVMFTYIDGDGPAVPLSISPEVEELEKKIAPDQSSAGFLD